MSEVADRLGIFQHAVEIRLLEDDRGGRPADGRLELRGIDPAVRSTRNAENLVMLGLRVGLQHLSVLRVERAGHHHVLAIRVRHRHGGCLRQRRRAVVKRGVRDVEAGEQRDHALKLVGRLERALAGFGLVGRIGRVEVRPRNHLVDDRGAEPARGARAEEAVRG